MPTDERSGAATPTATLPPARRFWRGRPAIICAALAALVFASRAWLAHAWGSAVPFWDEWDVEAMALYRPWLNGTLTFGDLLKAHNEHHLFLTRVADLGFFLLYGRWEPWSQIILNAALHAATATALAALFWSALPPRLRAGFVCGVAVLFTAICGWQNALLGIQSQVYFSSLLAVGALAGLTLAPPWTRRWWLGWAAALLALFTFAGGVFAALAAVIVGAIFPPRDRRTKGTWAALAFVAAVAVFGLSLFVEPAGQVPLHSQGLVQFYATFVRCLSWPHVNSPVLWLLMQLPLAALVVERWRRRAPLDDIERFALGLAVFAVFQAAAVAHNRAAGLLDARPLSRYQDPLLLGVTAQWFAVLRLAARHGRTSRLLALAWSGAAALGLLTLTTANLSLNLPYKRAQDIANLAQVRAYLATHDATVFTRDPLYPGPHPDPRAVQRVLDDPVLRPVLPEIFFSSAAESDPATQPWVIAHGRLLVLIALAVFAAALAWPSARPDSWSGFN